MASWRLFIGVVPAWLANPSMVTSHQFMPTIPSTTPISIFLSSKKLPCSMCSSINALIVPFSRSASESLSGLPPIARMPSRMVLPLWLTTCSASGVSLPIMARLPTRPPSSSEKTTTSKGWRVVKLFSCKTCAHSIEPITPTSPS